MSSDIEDFLTLRGNVSITGRALQDKNMPQDKGLLRVY